MTAETWPAIGRPACWCSLPAEYHSANMHEPDERRRHSLYTRDELSMAVSGAEVVTADNGRSYTQCRATFTDRAGRRGIARFVRVAAGPDAGRWWLDWATDTGWILANEAARYGWLEPHDAGPGTFGHVDLYLP
jgi:hypothetical protein